MQLYSIGIPEEQVSLFLYSFTEAMDYYGQEEDVAVWSVEQNEYPIVANKSFIRMPVKQQLQL